MRKKAVSITLAATIVGALIGGATVTTAAPPSPSPTEVVGQLEIAGLKGDGQHAQFPGAVRVRSFDFSATKAGAKDAQYRRFQIAAGLDSAAVGLLERLSQGTVIPTVKLSLTHSTGDGLFVSKTYTLSGAKVVTLREYASGQSGDFSMMELAFAYKKIAVEHNSQAPGGQTTKVDFCWILASASKC